MESKNFQTKIHLKVNTIKESRTEKENTNLKMEQFIKGNFMMDCVMEKEN